MSTSQRLLSQIIGGFFHKNLAKSNSPDSNCPDWKESLLWRVNLFVAPRAQLRLGPFQQHPRCFVGERTINWGWKNYFKRQSPLPPNLFPLCIYSSVKFLPPWLDFLRQF